MSNEDTQQKTATVVYAEMTPNPATMKFVANRMLVEEGTIVEYNSIDEAQNSSPLAVQLFSFPFVQSVFITANFVTLAKTDVVEWDDITIELREFIKEFLENNDEVVTALPEEKDISGEEEVETTNSKRAQVEPQNEKEEKIVDALENYVKPAVEGDGGAIDFQSFKNGVVTVSLRGACSGCPSSTVTLKQGIEALLKQTVPEVESVEALEE